MLSDFFEWLYQILHQVTRTLGYPGIFLLMVLENVFPPIPSEVVMPFAGFLVQRGEFNMVGVLLAGTLGSLLGTLFLYYVGKKLGKERLDHWIDKNGKYVLLSRKDLDRAMDAFERHGNLAIFIGRLIPGIRSLISIPAGLNEMDIKLFLILTTLGTLLWNMLLTYSGYLLGSNWQQILSVLSTYENFILIGIGLLLIFFIGKKLLKREAAQTAE